MKDLTFYVVSFTFLFCMACILFPLLFRTKNVVIQVGQFEFSALYDLLRVYKISFMIRPCMNADNELICIEIEIDRKQYGYKALCSDKRFSGEYFKTLIFV